MTGVSWDIPTADDFDFLAQHVRPEDEREVVLISRKPFRQSVEIACRMSRSCGVARNEDGEAYAIFGVQPTIFGPRHGSPWMMCSNLVDACPVKFYKQSSRAFQLFSAGYDSLENCVWAGNVRSIRWLEFLGFEISDRYLFVNGEKFHRFHWERSPCASQQ